MQALGASSREWSAASCSSPRSGSLPLSSMERPAVAPTGPPAGCTHSFNVCTAAEEAYLGGEGVVAGFPVSPHAPPPLPTPSADALKAHELRLLGPSAGDGRAGAGGLGGADGETRRP